MPLVKAGGLLEASHAVLSPTTVPDKMKAIERDFFVWALRSAFFVTLGSFKGVSALFKTFYAFNSINPLSIFFSHLADAFIQSDLQLHSGYTFSLVCVFPGNRTHNLLRC